MSRLGTYLQLEVPKRVITIGEKGDLLVHLEVLRVQHLIQTALRLCVECLHKSKALDRGRPVFFTLCKAPDALTDNDFKFMLLVDPIAHVSSVNPHCEEALWRGEEIPRAGLTLDKTRLFIPQLRFQPFRHLERVIAHRFDVETEINRQKILEGIQAQPVGDQRGPLGFYITHGVSFLQTTQYA